MSNKLKAITTRAKQLYKTGKFAKWTDAIKEASKSLTKGKKVSGVKKVTKKKVIKKVTKKKATPKSYHKDTKSHNVKISVMSGVNKSEIDFWIKMFAPRPKRLQLEWYKDLVKSFKTNSFNIFTPKEKGEAQLRALELLLNKKPLIIK